MLNKAFFIIAAVTSGSGTTSYETIASDFSEINNFSSSSILFKT